VFSQEIEGVLGVHVPLGLALGPVRGALTNVGLPNEGVLRHAARLHRPTVRLPWVVLWANLTHLVNHHPVLPEHNGVVSVEPGHGAQHLTLVHNGRICLRISHHVNPSWRNGALQVELLRRRRGAVVVDLHGVWGQIDRFHRRVVHLQRFVVARALDVFADDQIVAQPRLAALQDVHLQEVAAQTVASVCRCVVHPRPRRHGAVHQTVLVAQPPHVVVSRFFEGGKIKERLVGGGQHRVLRVANQEHVFVLCCVAEVPKRHQRAVLRQQTRLGVWLCACRKDRATVAGGNLAGLALEGDDFVRQAHAPVHLRRAHVRQGGGRCIQDGVVRHRHHVVAAVAKPFHVDGGAQEHFHHHVCARLQDDQACGRRRRIRLVCESHNLRPQIGAKCGDTAVQRQVSSFARQHVGGSWAEGLHHELLVEGRAAVRHPRQPVRACIHPLPSFVDRAGGVGVDQSHNGRHLRVGDRRVAVEHRIRNPREGGRRIQLELRRGLGGEHHACHGVLPSFALQEQEPFAVQSLALEVDHILNRGGPIAPRERRLDDNQSVAVHALVGGAVQLDKLTRVGSRDEVDFVEDDLGFRGERQTAECGEQSEKLAFHGERCEWGSKVAYLSSSRDDGRDFTDPKTGRLHPQAPQNQSPSRAFVVFCHPVRRRADVCAS